jgi:hypothetical protein
MYMSAYKADPASYNPDNRKGGGYWLFDQRIPEATPSKGTSTYAAELGSAKSTADVQLQRSLGLNILTSQSEQARQGWAGMNRTTPVHVPTTSTGDLLGWVICASVFDCVHMASSHCLLPVCGWSSSHIVVEYLALCTVEYLALCTVILDVRSATSCMMFAILFIGSEITSICFGQG